MKGNLMQLNTKSTQQVAQTVAVKVVLPLSVTVTGVIIAHKIMDSKISLPSLRKKDDKPSDDEYTEK